MPHTKAVRPKCTVCKRKPVKRAGAKFCSIACSNKARAKPKEKKLSKSAEKKLSKLPLKNQKLLKGVLEGKTRKQAAIDAGYPPKSAASQASQILNKPKIAQTMAEILDSIGVSDHYLATHLKGGLEASKTVSMVPMKGSSSGDLTDAGGSSVEFVDVPDWGNRNKYFKDALGLRGHIGDVQVQPTALNVQINIRARESEQTNEISASAVDANEVPPPARVKISVGGNGGGKL